MRFSRLRKRMRSDSAAAVTILALALLMLFMFISVFMVDFVKNTQIRNAYEQTGQRATQAALIQQNGVGGLIPQDSADALVREYMLETRGTTSINAPDNQADGQESANYVGSQQTQDTAAFRRNQACQVIHGGQYNGRQYPVIKITYQKNRLNSNPSSTDPTVTSVGGEKPDWQTDQSLNFAQSKYRVVSATITDVSDNYFYGLFGNPCQEYTIHVSSVAVDKTNATDRDN